MLFESAYKSPPLANDHVGDFFVDDLGQRYPNTSVKPLDAVLCTDQGIVIRVECETPNHAERRRIAYLRDRTCIGRLTIRAA
jgi:hypothetical protein